MGLYGNYSHPFLPYTGGQVTGQRLDYCTVIPPAANAHYVRSTGAADYDPPELTGRIFSTINSALLECRSGRGDVVYVLPGHAETISAADGWSNLVAGTRILGNGYGSIKPTITFSATGSTILIDVADTWISGLKFVTAASTTVTVGLVGSAANFHFVGNEVDLGSSSSLWTNFATATSACTGWVWASNEMYSTVTAAFTTVLTTTGACSRFKLLDNFIMAGPVTAATGVLFDFSNAACLNCVVTGNMLWNNTASSKFVIKPHANMTGWVHQNVWGSGDGSTAPASSGFSTYTTDMRFGINQAVTAISVSALLSPTVDS